MAISISRLLGMFSGAESTQGKATAAPANQAPTLPLAGCSTSGQCACSYRKHADRRSGEDRRLGMPGEKSQWYHGGERRNPNGRRHDD